MAFDSPKSSGVSRPADALAALARVAAVVRDAEGLPTEVREWFSDGLQAYVSGARSLDAALNLKARRGGRYETPHAEQQRADLHGHIRWLIESCPGDSVNQKARVISLVMAGQATAPNRTFEERLRCVVHRHGGAVPGSQVALARTIRLALLAVSRAQPPNSDMTSVTDAPDPARIPP